LVWEIFITRTFEAHIKVTLTAAGHSWTEFSTEITYDPEFFSLEHSVAGMPFIVLDFCGTHATLKTNRKITVRTRTFHAGIV